MKQEKITIINKNMRDELEKTLECIVSHEVLVSPVTFSCGHSISKGANAFCPTCYRNETAPKVPEIPKDNLRLSEIVTAFQTQEGLTLGQLVDLCEKTYLDYGCDESYKALFEKDFVIKAILDVCDKVLASDTSGLSEKELIKKFSEGSGLTLQYIDRKQVTEKIALLALHQDKNAIRYIPEELFKNNSIFNVALAKNRDNKKFILKSIEWKGIEAYVGADGTLQQDKDIILHTLETCPEAPDFIPEKLLLRYPEIRLWMLKKNPTDIDLIIKVLDQPDDKRLMYKLSTDLQPGNLVVSIEKDNVILHYKIMDVANQNKIIAGRITNKDYKELESLVGKKNPRLSDIAPLFDGILDIASKRGHVKGFFKQTIFPKIREDLEKNTAALLTLLVREPDLIDCISEEVLKDENFVLALLDKKNSALVFKMIEKNPDARVFVVEGSAMVISALHQDKKVLKFLLPDNHPLWANDHFLEELAEKFSNDKEIMLRVVSKKGALFEKISADLKLDKQMYFAAVNNDENVFKLIPEKLKKKNKFWNELFAEYKNAYHSILIFTDLIERNAVNGTDSILSKASEIVRSNSKVVILALHQRKDAVKFISENLWKDESFLKDLLVQFDDETIVLEVMKRKGSLLEFVSPVLKDNVDIIYAALENDPTAIKHVPKNIMSGSKPSSTGLAWKLKNNKFFDSKEIFLAMINNRWATMENGTRVSYLSVVNTILKNDPEIIIPALLQEDVKVMEYVPAYMWSDEHLLKLLCINYPKILLDAIKEKYVLLENLPNAFKENEVFINGLLNDCSMLGDIATVVKFMQWKGSLLPFVAAKSIRNIDVIYEALKNYPKAIQFVPKEFIADTNDKSVELVKKLRDDKFFDSKEIFLEVIQNGWAAEGKPRISYLSEVNDTIKNDPNIIFTALSQEDVSVMAYVPQGMWKNECLLKLLCEKHPKGLLDAIKAQHISLKNLPNEFKENAEFIRKLLLDSCEAGEISTVVEFMKWKGSLLEFVPSQSKQNIDVIYAALENDPTVLKHVPKNIMSDSKDLALNLRGKKFFDSKAIFLEVIKNGWFTRKDNTRISLLSEVNETLKNDTEVIIPALLQKNLKVMEYVPEYMWSNDIILKPLCKNHTDVLRDAIKAQHISLKNLPDEYQNKTDFIKELLLFFCESGETSTVIEFMKWKGSLLEFLPYKSKQNIEIIYAALENDTAALNHVPEDLIADSKELAAKLVDKKFFNSKDLVLKWIEKDGAIPGTPRSSYLSIVNDTLKNEQDVVIAALSQKDVRVMEYVPKEMWQNTEVLKTLCAQNRKVLVDGLKGKHILWKEVPSEFKENTDFIKEVLRYTCDMDAKSVVLDVVKGKGGGLEYVSEIFKKDVEVVYEALQKDPMAITYVPEDLIATSKELAEKIAGKKFFNNKDLVLKWIEKDGAITGKPRISYLSIIDEKLKKDLDVLYAALLQKNVKVIEFVPLSMWNNTDLLKKLCEAKYISVLFDALKEKYIAWKDVTAHIAGKFWENAVFLDALARTFPKDKTILLEVVTRKGSLLLHADEALTKDLSIVLPALKSDERAIQHIHCDVWKNPEFQKEIKEMDTDRLRNLALDSVAQMSQKIEICESLLSFEKKHDGTLGILNKLLKEIEAKKPKEPIKQLAPIKQTSFLWTLVAPKNEQVQKPQVSVAIVPEEKKIRELLKKYTYTEKEEPSSEESEAKPRQKVPL